MFDVRSSQIEKSVRKNLMSVSTKAAELIIRFSAAVDKLGRSASDMEK